MSKFMVSQKVTYSDGAEICHYYNSLGEEVADESLAVEVPETPVEPESVSGTEFVPEISEVSSSETPAEVVEEVKKNPE